MEISNLGHFSRIFIKHVEDVSARMFFSDQSEVEGTSLHLLAIRYKDMFKPYTDDQRKIILERVINDSISKFGKEWTVYEPIIDRTIMYCYKIARTIPRETMMISQLLTCDFSLKHSLQTAKLNSLKPELKVLNYKEVRHFFKYLYEHMKAIPYEITPGQMPQLQIIQDMLISIMSRESNMIPGLFIVSEIGNMTKQRTKIFPTVIEATLKLEDSFRRLAELWITSARAYLFPIPSHPSFHSTAILWRLDPIELQLHHRLNLPFRMDMYSPQSYVLLMLLRQYKAKDSFRVMIKMAPAVRDPDPTKVATLDTVALIMIGEAMLYTERFPHHPEHLTTIWENISTVIQTLVYNGWCDMNRLLTTLAKTVETCGYRRAKDELMWTILQNLKTVNRGEGLKEAMDLVAKMYKHLYEKNKSINVSTECPLKMVRSLAAACIWIDLSGGDLTTYPPPEPLVQQIEFITKRNQSVGVENMSTLALMMNAYSNNSPQEMKYAVAGVFDHIKADGATFMMGDHKTVASFEPLHYDVLTAMGVRGQQQVLQEGLNRVRDACQDLLQPMPSPALIETVARLTCMGENDSRIGSLFARFVEETKEIPRDPRLLFVLCELMSYRCIVQPYQSRSNVMCAAFQLIFYLGDGKDGSIPKNAHALTATVRRNYDLYTALELLVLRLALWLDPVDMIHFVQKYIIPQFSMTKSHVLIDKHPPALYAILQFPHDLAKALFVQYLKASKLLGLEVSSELIRRINECFNWTESQVRYLHEKLIPNPIDFEAREQAAFQAYIAVANSDSIRLQALPDDQISNYFQSQEAEHGNRPVTIFSALFRNVYEGRKMTPEERAGILNSLREMDVPHQITAINSLVDYLVQEAKNNDVEQFSAACSKALAQLVITDEMIPIDRFFFTAAFTTRSDESTRAVLALIRAITRDPAYSEMTKQLMQLPAMGSNEFLKKMNDLRTRRRSMRDHERIHDINPAYYGHPLLKILSSVDALLERALQLNIPDAHFKELLDAFSPLYRFHPYPLTYLLSTLSPLYGCTDYRDDLKPELERQQLIKQRPRARAMVLQVLRIDSTSPSPSPSTPFSPHFLSSSPMVEGDAREIAMRLTEGLVNTFRIGRVTDDSLSPDSPPPPYMTGEEWKSVELSPHAYTLHAIACECLASGLSNEVLGRAFVEILYLKRIRQPLLYLNAVALILTTLPYSYSQFLYDEIIYIFKAKKPNSSQRLANTVTLDQSIFESYEYAALQTRASRVHAVMALTQAFWHHANAPILNQFESRFRNNLEKEIKTEKDLFMVLHIIIPLLQRIADAKEKSHVDRCFRMVVMIYDILKNISKNDTIKEEDAVADLLYHFKYMFVGDFVKENINKNIEQFKDTLKAKLTFIIHGEGMERKDSMTGG